MPGKQQGHWWIQKANKKQVLQVNKYKKNNKKLHTSYFQWGVYEPAQPLFFREFWLGRANLKLAWNYLKRYGLNHSFSKLELLLQF